MASVSFTVPGNPQGKARPRFGNGHTYTPAKTVMYENLIRACYRRMVKMLGHENPFQGQVQVYITAVYPIPKSASKKRRGAMLGGKLLPTVKPDLDNVIKAVLDALNGVAYLDDSQIVSLSASKRYGITPRVEVLLEGEPNDL